MRLGPRNQKAAHALESVRSRTAVPEGSPATEERIGSPQIIRFTLLGGVVAALLEALIFWVSYTHNRVQQAWEPLVILELGLLVGAFLGANNDLRKLLTPKQQVTSVSAETDGSPSRRPTSDASSFTGTGSGLEILLLVIAGLFAIIAVQIRWDLGVEYLMDKAWGTVFALLDNDTPFAVQVSRRQELSGPAEEDWAA